MPGGGLPGRGTRRLLLLAVAGLTAAAAAGFIAVITVIASITGTGAAVAVMLASAGSCVAPAPAQAPYGTWSAQAMTNAATIISVGEAAKVPPYGWEIAVATAIQESQLVNLSSGDRDSLGLFQQRPSQGWGTPAQIMDPAYAAGRFYQALLQVPGWQSLPLTVAAQDVQHSGFPGAYARWQDDAARIVTRLAGPAAAGLAAVAPAPGGCAQGQPAQATPAQLQAVLKFAVAALGTMYQFGGTCTDPHSANMALHCDCSSLVQQAFAQIGLRLPRTAAGQYQWGLAGHAAVIPLSQARTGDVVYMPSYLGPDTIAHTGIVVDPARQIMLDAYSTGQPVQFNSYAPAHDPYGSRLLTIMRFVLTPAGSGG
jgi:cell wall-associated NlpC family hydrolase